MPVETEHARWFADEVQPHESALRAYLRHRFPKVADVDDVVQESYIRLLRARQAGPIASAKSYLFTTARNVALALLRRPRIFSEEAVSDDSPLRLIESAPDAAELVSQRQEIALLLEAIDGLPSRCRAIFIMRKLEGVAQKEIARRLGLSEQTVQVQVARGARKCVEYLRSRGVTPPSEHA